MAYYYKYNFVSPEPIFATVKEELKSYFDSGAIDDLLFPTYVNKCLNKLGKSSYNIVPTILNIEDFEARLPDNFHAVREAWLCTTVDALPYQSANSFYSQASSETTIQVSPVTSGGKPCTNEDCLEGCDDGDCMPVLIQAVYKTNNEILRSYKRQYLLKPGNISVKAHCSLDCKNFGSSSAESFDIRDNKFVVNFRKGNVYLVFYAYDYDDTSNQLIPDNYRIREYIEHFLKFKCFETLTNQVNDETFNQLEQKKAYYKNLADEAYILAEIEIKKKTPYEKIRGIQDTLDRNKKYEVHTGRWRSTWRRN